MKGVISVKRGKSFVKFAGDFSPDMPITMILEEINSRDPILDIKGREASPIEWECSCQQKICGSCSMVINGKPRLACSTFFRDVGPKVTLEPLSKFPVVADLKVDRSRIYDSLSEMKIWLDEADAKLRNVELQYESADCMLCGCCLEVCPNYNGKDKFFGAAGMNACFRIVDQLEGAGQKSRLREFSKHGKEGCSNSLACEAVCPAEIPLSVLISRLNREKRRIKK